jgi:heptosyltransferase-2
MKILVVAPSWIGDTIIAQALFMRLHEQHPGLLLNVLAAAWSAPLLARMPEVNRSIASPFAHGEFGWEARRRLGRTLRQDAYDQAIVLPNSWKSALVPYFAGIPRRTGYQGEARYLLLNDRHRLEPVAMPQLVERYAALAGASTRPLKQPRLTSTIAQQQAARQNLGLPLEGSPIVFCPGAEYGPAKRWPARHFAALAKLLRQRGERQIWLIGSAKDQPIGAEIAALANGNDSEDANNGDSGEGGTCLNLCGRTDLAQAIDLMASASLVVSNDSGLMHVAAALDRPLLALYGSSSPAYTPPLSSRAKIISLGVECSPCFKRECPLGHFKCLNELSPEAVLEKGILEKMVLEKIG